MTEETERSRVTTSFSTNLEELNLFQKRRVVAISVAHALLEKRVAGSVVNTAPAEGPEAGPMIYLAEWILEGPVKDEDEDIMAKVRGLEKRLRDAAAEDPEPF